MNVAPLSDFEARLELFYMPGAKLPKQKLVINGNFALAIPEKKSCFIKIIANLLII
jgi:hypothetical protein